MDISVVVVCYNEEKNIESCINSILKNKFNSGVYEIVVVDGDSTDATPEILKKLQQKNQNIKIISIKKRNISLARQTGVENSSYEFIAFTDADCEVPENWLEILSGGYNRYSEKEKLAGAGGSNIPPSINSANPLFYRSLGIMLNSFVGSRGSVQGKILKDDAIINHIPCVNVLYKKSCILEIGGFDIKMGNIGEDQDLTYRLNKAGYKFIYLKDSFVIHKLRTGPKSWSKNMFVYGKGRMWLIKKHPGMLNIFFAAPIILVLSFFYAPNWNPLLYIPIYYVLFICIYSVYISGIKNLVLAPYTAFLFFITHIPYGLGEICGLFKKRSADI